MTRDFMFDVETLSTESTAVVLSAAICYFDLEEEVTFEQLKERTLFVKFNSREQLTGENKRHISKSTLDWWSKQAEFTRARSLLPHKDDLNAADGIDALLMYVETFGEKNSSMWARGSLDQMCIDSLCNWAGKPPLTHFNNWMDVRTALRCLKDTINKYGYCDIPNFDRDLVAKHDPVDDVCIDILQLRYSA